MTRGLFAKRNRKAVERRSGARLTDDARGTTESPRAVEEQGAYVNRVEEFLSEKGRRWSPSTIELYRRYLLDLGRWLEQHPPVGVDDITTRMLVRWLDARPYWGASSQYTAIVAVRSFFRWRVGRDASPAERLPLPRRPIKPHRTLDEVTAYKLLTSIDTSTRKGVRDVALVALMLETGLRASEVCRLRVNEVDLMHQKIDCRRKGGRWGKSVFCEYTQACLERWLAIRESVAAKSVPTVFVGVGGTTRGRPFTRDGLRTVLQQLGKKAGIGPLSPHDLRRSMATLSTRAGAPLLVVKAQGNWSDVSTMQRYTQDIEPQDFKPYSPVAKLMGFTGDDDEAPPA